MAELPSSFDVPVLPSTPSSSSSFSGVSDDSFEDSCSICLESFTSEDPSTVTNCKHEYHLQCIIEWSQRSKECPICWQILSLKDPTSQELLAAVDNERSSRSTRVFYSHGEYEDDNDAPYTDESDFNVRIMQHLAAAAAKGARFTGRRERQNSGLGASQGLVFGSPTAVPQLQNLQSSPEYPISSYGSSESDSPNPRSPISTGSQSPPHAISSVVNMISREDLNMENQLKYRVLHTQPPANSAQRSSASELHSISESIKSKFSAASARYKESLTKGTKGLKEKLMTRNNSVKELSKGVQREMSAGIAGVTRMLERLDPMAKRTGVPVPAFESNRATSDFSYKGKGVQNAIPQSLDRRKHEIPHDFSDVALCHASAANPARVEISPAKSEH